MNLDEIRDLIRAEAGIEGDNTYQNLLDAVINQELSALTGKSKYRELLDWAPYTIATTAEHLFDLPTNYQLFNSLSFQKSDAETDDFTILQKGKAPRSGLKWSGNPVYFYFSASQINVYPFSSIEANDGLVLSYYAKNVLVEDDDELLVPSLERPLILACVARMTKMKDTRKGQVIANDAQQAWLETRTENAGND